jgi:hypothetical protein
LSSNPPLQHLLKPEYFHVREVGRAPRRASLTPAVNSVEPPQSPPVSPTKAAIRIGATLETHSGGNDAQIIRAHVNNVTWMELSAAPHLGLTVDGHLTSCDQELRLSSARGDTSKLQHLAKADHVAGDFDQSLHTKSISGPTRRGHPKAAPVTAAE